MSKIDINTTFVPTNKDGDKLPDKSKKLTVTVDWPDDLAGLQKMFGEEAVNNAARAALKVDIQNDIRVAMGKEGKDKLDEDEIIEKFGGKNWKPGTKKRGKTPAEKARDMLAKLDPETRKRMLKEAAAA